MQNLHTMADMNMTTTPEAATWITPQAAAELSEGLASRPTFQKWAEEGKISAIQLPNGWWRIERRAVEEMVGARRPAVVGA